jgi:hypothetical protein
MGHYDGAGPAMQACTGAQIREKVARPGTFEVIGKVLDELERARAKHRPCDNQHGAWAVVKEELDEAWDAVKADFHEHAKHEMVQVAAMAIRFILET